MSSDTDAYERIIGRHYRWWTVFTWKRDECSSDAGIKLGPVSLFWYLWTDGRLRVSMSVLGHAEHILWGGPLA